MQSAVENALTISVSTGPGFTAFTVARSLNSLAHVLVIASSAAFVPPYTLCPGKPSELDTEERLTMRPDRSYGRYGSAACMSRSGPRTLVLYCFWKSAIMSLSAVEEEIDGVTKRFPATPALLTMMLIVRSPDCACAK